MDIDEGAADDVLSRLDGSLDSAVERKSDNKTKANDNNRQGNSNRNNKSNRGGRGNKNRSGSFGGRGGGGGGGRRGSQRNRGGASNRHDGGRRGGDNSWAQGRASNYENVSGLTYVGGLPEKSIEGWVVIATNVHEEAQDADVMDHFADYGKVKTLHLNLERRTGFVKGYALVEFGDKKAAQDAVKKGNGSTLLGQKLSVDWAFVRPDRGDGGGRRRSRSRG